MIIIEAIDLRKVYSNGKVALDGLSLQVGQGEVFGFLGPNGAGKTTAIKIMVGLVSPTAGAVKVFGLPPGHSDAKSRLGFLPELFRFYDWLTGRELLELHARLCHLPLARRDNRIRETLALVGLSDAADRRIGSYSKGMQQRIGLAQALLCQPELVLLDEPTSALDPLGRRQVRDIIHRLKSEGVTIFLNSHLLSEVELVCDNVAIVDAGRVVRSGPLAELVAGQTELRVMVDEVTPDLISRLGSIATIRRIGEAEVVLDGTDPESAPMVARVVAELGLKLYGLVPRQPNLEDIFVESVEAVGKPMAASSGKPAV